MKQKSCARLSLFIYFCAILITSAAYPQTSEKNSISGRLLMRDNATPHVAVVIQAIGPLDNSKSNQLSRPEENVAETTLTDEHGRYQLSDLKPGRYKIRCYTLNGYVYYQEGKLLNVRLGAALTDIDFRTPAFKKGRWTHLTYLDGLLRNDLLRIHRDADGVMWFITTDGLSRYDGDNLVNFEPRIGIPDEKRHLLPRNVEDMIWTGTAQQQFVYDGEGFMTFTTEDGLASPVVHDIHRDPDGVMWFATAEGVSRYDGEELINFTTDDGLVGNYVRVILPEPDGALWFGAHGGISRYDRQRFTNFTPQDGLMHEDVLSLHRDLDATLWIGTRHGLSRFDGEAFVNFTTKDGLLRHDIQEIHRHSDGDLWFATGGGVVRYDGKDFVNYTPSDGLLASDVSFIHSDPSGALWFATSGGVSRYDEETFLNFTTQDGLTGNYINSMSPGFLGKIWFGTRRGVSRWDGETFVNFTTDDGLASNNVVAIHRAEDGAMWFGTYGGGLSRYDGERFVNFTDGLHNNRVNALATDLQDNLWIGIDEGHICRYDGNTIATIWRTETEAAIQDIYRDAEGILWFGTGWYHSQGGVFRYDGNQFQSYSTADGLAHYVVHSIYGGADGSLWFGTGGGASHFDGETWTTFTKNDGLAGNHIRGLYRDSEGVMWFGTESGGISGYDGTAWTSLDTRDGLPGNKVKIIYQDADGYLWFGTSGGLARYRKSPAQPTVRIDSVKTASAVYTDLHSIPPILTGERITIMCDAVDFKTLPQKRQYRYRIKSNASIPSDRWNPPAKQNAFDIAFDKPGTYTFEVEAIDRDLNYSAPVTVMFQVVPPWYKNGWIAFPAATAILALLISSTVYGSRYYAQRRESIRLREQMLQQERHSRQALEVKNTALTQTLEELRNTQNQLIESEKMAALGQLIAGLAHEVNTPLGAIQSSVGNISTALEQSLDQLPQLFEHLSADEQSLFFSLIERSVASDQPMTAREARRIRRGLTRQLDAEGIADADSVADTLVDMGIVADVEPYLSLLDRPQGAEILRTAYQLSGLQRSAQNITIAAERAGKVVFALRTYAHDDPSGEKVQANITEGIETVLTLYDNQLRQGVEVVRNYEEIPQILCYPDELNQVWTNIIHNALQAMDYKGTLTIDVAQQDNNIAASITDSGCGIPQDIQDKIFDAFFTTKPAGEGSGLGLDIVKKILDKHQGDIQVESEPGKTTFRVLLPIAA